jgi:glycosyltransferase involved in cell wall biosynthesis
MQFTSHDGGQKYICKGPETHRWTPLQLADALMFPLVSVICPTKDRPQFMARLIEGFMAQDYPGPAELIVIEDGAASEFLVPVSIEGPRQTYRYRAEGAPPTLGGSLNQAIRLARGEYLFRFDDDDWQAPCRISRQMQLFEMTGKAVVANSSGLYWSEGGDAAYEYTGDPWNSPGLSHAFTREYGLAHPHLDANDHEDITFLQESYELGELATISGARWQVNRNHRSERCSRRFDDPIQRATLLASDNWRQVPVERVHAILRRD